MTMIPSTTDLAHHSTVEQMVTAHDSAVADITQGFRLVDAAMARLGAAFEQDGRKMSARRRGQYLDFDDPGEMLREIRREAWRAVLARLKVRQAMSIKAWSEMERKLNDGEPPPFTVEAVEAVVRQLRADLPDMIQASIAEVFDWLRPRQSQYRTNTEYSLGRKVVLTSMVRVGYGKWDVEDYADQKLIALENVFCMCDGKPGRAPTGYYANIATAIKALPLDGPCVGETEYFSFRGWRNGNLHLTFKRMDLVKRLNAIAGGARLVPVGQEAA